MSINHLLTSMNRENVFSKMFDDREVFVRTYNKDNVLVGEELIDFIKTSEKGEVPRTKKFGFDFSTGNRICLIGLVGSGKTFTTRAIMERMFKTNFYNVVLLPDVKNEFQSSINPAPLKQHKHYAVGEKPQGFPIMSFKPSFFKTFRIHVPDNETNKPTGFKVSDLSFTDIKEIFNIDELPPLQKAFIQDLAFAIQKGKIKIDTMNDLRSLIDREDNGLNAASKAGLKLKLNAFFSMDFFEEPVENPVEWLNNDKIVALNLELSDTIDKKNGAPHLALSIWHRLITSARRQDVLKKKRVFIVIDEANRFVPNNMETSVKFDILEGIEIFRAYMISYLFCYQTFKSVPMTVLENSRYIMVPSNASVDTFWEIYKSTGIYKRHANTLRNHVSFIKSRMRKFAKYCWLVFDRQSGSEHIVSFYSPMSEHCTKD